MFPNEYTIWRNTLIEPLISDFDVDIIVYKPDNQKIYYKYGDAILSVHGILNTILKIRRLYLDTNYYSEIQKAQHKFFVKYFGYRNQQKIKFKFISKIISNNSYKIVNNYV